MIEYILCVIIVIFFSMVLHEIMHGYVALWLGDDTAKMQGRLTLNPVAHIDPIMTLLLPIMLAIVNAPIFGAAKPVQVNNTRLKYGEWGMALVAIAGPLTNLLIAFICFAILAYGGFGLSFQGVSSMSFIEMLLRVGVMVNLGFFAFNMLPIPPLDGSRVLYAIAPDFIRQGLEVMERMGLIVIAIIVILGQSLLSGVMAAIVNGCLQLFARILGIFS